MLEGDDPGGRERARCGRAQTREASGAPMWGGSETAWESEWLEGLGLAHCS